MSDTTTESPSGADRPHTPILRTLAIATGLTAIIAVIVLAFSWPAVTADPDDVTIAVVGPETAVSAIETQLTEESDGVFDITAVDDRDEAVEGIEERDYFGAIILGTEPELLTASANGAVNEVVAQLATPLNTALTAQAQAAAEASGQAAPNVTLTVTDIVPFSEEDPNGSLLSSAFFPMLLGGIIAGIATPMIGFVALIGRVGTAVGPVVMMLFANPISGAALPPQFLPGSWGEIGQWFPPGAAATLVRELSYFPNADMTLPWLVLTGWVVGGLILPLVGRLDAASAPSPAHPRFPPCSAMPREQKDATMARSAPGQREG